MGERNISARCSGHKKTKSHTSARGASSVGVRAHTGITPWSRGQGQPDLNHDPYFDTQTTLPTTVAHRPRRPRRPAAARGRGRPLALSILSFIVLPHGRASSASLLVLPCITCSCFQCFQCFHARASLYHCFLRCNSCFVVTRASFVVTRASL